MLRFCCIFLLVLVSCHIDKPTGNFKRILNNSGNIEISKLNLEGAYHNNSSDNSYYLGRPLFFFKNGLIYFDGISSLNQSNNETWLRKYLPERTTWGWGTYEIKGDAIKASIYYNFAHPITNTSIAIFEGIIKNKDTILEWQLVEPYPKLRKNTRREFDFLFKEKRDLYFKPLPIKPFMDSVSEKAWVLKYRDKK